jgi:large subunit ribosomal protein L11
MEGILKIAKMKNDVSYATTIKSIAKEIIGSCVSSGIKVENKPAKEIYSDVNDGKYDQILV